MHREPIKGYTDGIDYKISTKMCRLYSERKGWSNTIKEKPSRTFEYEFVMSRLGAKDSNNPAESIAVGYCGGMKSVEIWRKGKWSAVVCIDKDGKISSGQFQGEQGIEDLNVLSELYFSVVYEWR